MFHLIMFKYNWKKHRNFVTLLVNIIKHENQKTRVKISLHSLGKQVSLLASKSFD